MIISKFDPLLLIKGIQEQTTTFTESINEFALKVLGTRITVKKPLISREVNCDRMRKLKERCFKNAKYNVYGKELRSK